MVVKKSGRTTGLTRGKIVAIAVTINIGYPTECGGTEVQVARFDHQIRIRGRPSFKLFSREGDSGALVVEDKASCPSPVGLVFAGSGINTFANRIHDVLSAFDTTVVGCGASTAEARAQTEEVHMSAAEMATAIAVQQRHTDGLMQIPGVVGTGIGQSEKTGQVVIEVYLEKSTAALRRAIPHHLEGIPVRTHVTGKIYAR